MRTLILHRERALAAFALRYYCVFNQNATAYVQALEANSSTARMANIGDYALRNGETIRIALDEGCNTFFVIVYTESKNIVTNTVTIEPGSDDVAYTIVTIYDGYRKLNFTVVPTD